MVANGAPKDLVVVIAGLANEYSQYVATPEEYRTAFHNERFCRVVFRPRDNQIEVQRYEGASTLYGPYTLPAYQQEFAALAKRLMTKR